jgi:hypothetical protein
MGAHVLHNGLTYYWTLDAGPNQYGNLEVDVPWWGILVSTGLAILLGILLYRRRARELEG